ncbi:hypothetical protein niasHS_007617 [Heterodera schachtii]|uniref:ATP-dependent RNA helicase n=1 Tax=Heterodera schachtii TaxID=97005 RepID=A0ABD2JPN4_HETSC
MTSDNNDLALVVVSWLATAVFALFASHCIKHGRRESAVFLALLAVLIVGVCALAFVTRVPSWQLPAVLFRRFFDGTYFRSCLLLFWSLCSLASLLFICVIVHNRRHSASFATVGTSHRKFFHLTASLVTATGLFYDPSLLALCVHLVLQIFIIIEVLRSQRVQPFCHLDHWLFVFIDGRQESLQQITTPILLLIGLNLPILLDIRLLSRKGSAALLTINQWHFAGLISVGVGDSAAALIGFRFGRIKWQSLFRDSTSHSSSTAKAEENASLMQSSAEVIVPQRRRSNAKTVEGSMAMFVAQVLAAEWLLIFNPGGFATHSWRNGGMCCSVSDIVPSVVAALVATLVEAHFLSMSFSSDGMPNGLELLGVERARDENTASNFRAATGKPIKKQIQENLEEEIVNEDFFNVQEDQPPRRVPMMVLKSNIQRDKVRHNRFKLPERSHEDLFREKVRTGPAMKSLYENDELIDVRGGDGTALIMSDFDGFVPQLTKNIAEKGIERPTLIQKCVMPIILTKSEFDLLARAETGTGKTAAFLFPIIHLLESDRLAIGTNPSTGKKSPFAPEAIIISPTRELAQQLGDTARTYCRGTSLRVVITYGEIPIPDTLADVAQGCDLLVTTIGRLMQFANERKLKLNKLRFLVLDEADKLIFDSIFFKSVLKIKDLMLTHHKMQREFDKNAVSLPPRTLMLSATYGDSESAVARVLRPGFFCVTVGTNDQLVFASTIKQKLIEIESRQMKIDVLFNLLTQLQSGIVSSSGGVTWRRLKTKLVN